MVGKLLSDGIWIGIMREPPTGTIFRATGCGFGNAELVGNLSECLLLIIV